MRQSNWSAAFALALVIAGCAASPEVASSTAVQLPERPRLSIQEAVQVASDVATAKGINLAHFYTTMVHYRQGTWAVLFQGTRNTTGDHFGVYIDDSNGDARFHGGR